MSTQRYYSGIVKIFTLLVGLLSFTSQVIAKDYTISVFVDSSFKNHDDWVERYQENLKNELIEVFDIYWNDNQKARVFSAKQDNAYRKNKKEPLRAQFALYDYYKSKLEI